MQMRVSHYLFGILILAFSVTKAQNETPENQKPIAQYDQYNPAIGGDSLRYCNGSLCSGFIKDYYPNGNVKHKGFYVNGQLSNQYKNYYDNGQLERSWLLKDARHSILELYFRNGKMRSEVTYFKGQPIIWKDYYVNGNLEYWEEYDKNLEYYLRLNFYYENGKPQTTLEITDKRERHYAAKEYYNNGVVKEEGLKIFNASENDYLKLGIWKVYSSSGELIQEQNFVKGAEVGSDFEDIEIEEEDNN
ncbi:MAG: hypothetical protein KKA07_04795 [Bacteroidetes bacterium]|nr:hypothetical protein [Bacteroidota bacterium]MBU1718369.1 hypothetical protein [Bacteroidota bacterium]